MTQGLCVYLKPVKFRYLRMVLLLIPFRVHIYIYIQEPASFIRMEHYRSINVVWCGIRMVLIQMTWVYMNSLILWYPPSINIWLVLQFWFQSVRSLITSLISCNEPNIHLYTGPTLVCDYFSEVVWLFREIVERKWRNFSLNLIFDHCITLEEGRVCGMPIKKPFKPSQFSFSVTDLRLPSCYFLSPRM